MMTIRKSAERGGGNHGWLNTKHTFSFADYLDEAHMGFRGLRVINEDRVKAGMGFGTHGHRDMEIISYVLEGELEHKDSIGTGSVIRPGDVQRMSAGSGVRHSEFNGSKQHEVHFLQIWLMPEVQGIAPGYEEKRFSDEEKRGQLRLIASRAGEQGSLTMNADAKVYASVLTGGDCVVHAVPKGRFAWVHVAKGEVKLNGQVLSAGDGASFTDESKLTLEGTSSGEVLVFDLA